MHPLLSTSIPCIQLHLFLSTCVWLSGHLVISTLPFGNFCQCLEKFQLMATILTFCIFWKKKNFSFGFGFKILTMFCQHLANSGSFWQFMTTFGILWQLLTIYDNFWQIMSNFGNYWFTFGNFAIFSYVWKLSATIIISPCHLVSLAACQFASISINLHKTASISINQHQPASISFDEQQLASISNTVSIIINRHQKAPASISSNQYQSELITNSINWNQPA